VWTLVFQWKCTPGPQEYKWHTPWRNTQWHCQGVLYFQNVIRCHGMHVEWVELCQFSWNSRFRDNFFLKLLYQISWKSVLLGHRGMDVVSVYGDQFLLRKERPSSTRTNQKIKFLFPPVQESFSKPNLQFQAVLSDTGHQSHNTNYTLFPSALHVRRSVVFMWLDTTGRLPLNWSVIELYQWFSYTSGWATPVVELYQWLSYTIGSATPVVELYQWFSYTSGWATPVVKLH